MRRILNTGTNIELVYMRLPIDAAMVTCVYLTPTEFYQLRAAIVIASVTEPGDGFWMSSVESQDKDIQSVQDKASFDLGAGSNSRRGLCMF